jgi:hypothetical protein
MLDIFGDQCQQDDPQGPESLDDAPGQGAVLRREQLHHHRVGDALKALGLYRNAGKLLGNLFKNSHDQCT